MLYDSKNGRNWYIMKEIESHPLPLYNHKMKPIAFIDTEIEPNNGKILDIGGVSNNGAVFHKALVPEFISFLNGTQFVCGHNILNHVTKYIGQALNNAGIDPANNIDTLFLSPLLFLYHALLMLSNKIEQQD